MLIVIGLNVIVLNDIMLNLIILNVIMLNVIMLNVIMLNVIILIVLAPNGTRIDNLFFSLSDVRSTLTQTQPMPSIWKADSSCTEP